MDYELKIPDLHPGQALVKCELKKRNYICAHRGWRKSSLAIHLVIEHLLTGQNVGWFVPTFNTVTAANWVDFDNACGGDKAWFNKSENTWTMPGKETGFGTCFFFSVDRPGTARGPTFTLGIGEEMGEWQDGVFESVVQPIVKKANGMFVGVGTPNPFNPYNDFYKRMESAKKYPKTHASFLIPAWGADFVDGVLTEGVSPGYKYMSKELPFPTFQDVLDDYEQSDDPVKWKIEYLCQFISQAGGQFDNIDNCCSLRPILA